MVTEPDCALFEPYFPKKRDCFGGQADENDGSFFIDRDGQLFKYILNFLRDPMNFDVPQDPEVTRDLLKESAYFGLQVTSNKIPTKLAWLPCNS